MKMKSNTLISENRFLGSISASSIRNLLPKSASSKQSKSLMRKQSRSNSENTPPIDTNIQVENGPALPSISKITPPEMENLQKSVVKSDNHSEAPSPPDPSVKVVLRMRPGTNNGIGGQTVAKVSDDSVMVGDKKFTFDSVFDSKSSQGDIFQSVGVPLVKSALAGYNTSILAYGQTGSGKTYTMWGPPSAMVGHSADSHLGIVPRIFQMLFYEIQQKQENMEGKQLNYQCRCSFLEIYNGQIGDLLDPTQRNLEIKDDAKTGFYVENLTEEYVTTYDEVTQILIKGLSSRKVGATSVNSKSSRSHIVFTCIIESWCKGTSSNCFGSSRTSRISLIDLAGLDRNRLDDAGLKEGRYVRKSISQLGHLVNLLAERSQSGKHEPVPTRSSSLTYLLKESLGGNAKLTVICAVSPDNKYHGETTSTIRFGQRAKLIQNEPVINEITEDDVNDLSDQIRQLKEELIKAKSNVHHSVGSSYSYFNGRSVRESVNQLRVSLNRSLLLPKIDNDTEQEVNVDENDVKELCLQLDKLHATKDTTESSHFFSVEGCETDMTCEHYTSCPDESESEEIDSEVLHEEAAPRRSISINPCRQSVVLQGPTLSESPKIGNTLRKSVINSSSQFASQGNVLGTSDFGSDILEPSLKQSVHVRSSLQSSKIFPGPAESLAASLQRGLQIIDYHQRNSASNKSSVSFSFGNLTLKPCPTTDKVNASVQTSAEERQSSDGSSTSFLCASCRQVKIEGASEVQDGAKTWIAAVDQEEKGLSDAIKREELESICKEQAAKIEQLNLLVEQYKQKIEESGRKDSCNDLHLVESKDESLQLKEVRNENKLLRWNDGETNEQVTEEKCEIKEIQEDLDHHTYSKTPFDMNEKEALLGEIESLRNQLQSHNDASLNRSTGKLRSSLLSQSIQFRKSSVFSRGCSEEELEQERQRWTEMESGWISLTDELRIDIESIRQHAEKVEMELRLEKKCTEELDDALKRAVFGSARMVEHYVELQEKYNDLVEKHQLIMQGVADVKRAAAKAGAKGHGSRFAKSLAAELSALRVQKERERESLKKENRSLKIQLRDTAEAVHAAGELLVRLREAEQAASGAEDNFTKIQEENEKLKKQMEKLKRKHKMEMITMKQYLAESRLPEAALRPLYREDSDIANNDVNPLADDDQAWRAEFGATYQEHY